MMSQPEVSTGLEHLNAFVGIWETAGEIIANEQRVMFKGTDTYEWLPGHHFLFHRFEAKLPPGTLDSTLVRIEIIGYSQAAGIYTMHSFDSQGNANVMEGTFEEDNWTFAGDKELFTGGFHDSGEVFTGLLERREGKQADWQPWIEVIMKRVV